MGRKATDNWLWESYNKSKMKVKDSVDLKMSDHEKKVVEAFKMLGMSKTTSAADDLQEEDEFTTTDNLTAAKQFLDNDIFTEQGEDMLLEDDTTDDSENNHRAISEVGVEVEVDTDPAEALKSLSNLKKYRIKRLCVENLKEKGWSMLGSNIEEERKWTHTVK